MRPQNGALLWNETIKEAADTVLRGDAAYTRLPELAALQKRDLTPDRLAGIVDTLLGKSEPKSQNPRLPPALDAIHLTGGRLRIEALSTYLACSTRHLNRLFRAHIGLSAKTYAQLVQFHRALGLIRTHKLTITEAAFEGGFADQAHLTRTFRRFGGFVPSRIPPDLSLPGLFS